MPEELEKPCRVYPYDDDYMVFDPVFGRYVLTENALLHAGINLRARIARDSGVSAEDVIRSVCEGAFDAIYGYIHDFSVDNCAQDMAIAKLQDVERGNTAGRYGRRPRKIPYFP